MQVAEFDRPALAAAAPTVAALSTAEDLPAHGRAVAVRVAVVDPAQLANETAGAGRTPGLRDTAGSRPAGEGGR
jgi:hypothetical protein